MTKENVSREEVRTAFKRAAVNANVYEGKPALLGRANGQLYLNSTSRDLIWVRQGEGDSPNELVARIAGTPRQLNLPVLVALRDGELTVIGVDSTKISEFTGGSPLGVIEHAANHGRFGSDPLYITGPAFLPLMARPSSPVALTVTVESGFYRYLGTEKAFVQTVSGSFSSYLPIATRQTFVVLYLNRATNALGITASGTLYVGASALSPFTVDQVLTVVSTLSDVYFPIAAIRLFYGQTRIAAQDIFMDLRLWGGDSVAAGNLDSLSDVVITGAATDDILRYNGSNWVNDTSGGIALDDLSDVNIVGTPNQFDWLGYGVGEWVKYPLTTMFSQHTGNYTAPWLSWPIVDLTNGNNLQNAGGASTYPLGWTQTTAAAESNFTEVDDMWTLGNTSANTTWDFKKQSSVNIEALAANAYKSFWIGQILIKDGLYTNDVDYYFGAYASNGAGTAIDLTTFARMHIQWDSSGGIWQVRGEYKDGTTQTDGTWYPLAQHPLQPIVVRITLKNDTNKNATIYLGNTPFYRLHMPVLTGAIGSGVTWQQVWWRFNMSRNLGVDDAILIDGYDTSDDA